MPSNTSPKRRPSRTASRRSRILPSLPAKMRPGLALDTSVSRHRAPAPQQVFPYKAKTQELSFISLADIKALRKQKSINRARQKQLGEAQNQASQRLQSEHNNKPTEDQDVPPPYTHQNPFEAAPPLALHKRVKGLRPSPLDLDTDISPFDRAIPIGLSVDSHAVSTHSQTPSSPAAAPQYADARTQRRPSEKHNGQEAVTPTIIVTPAKEDFDFDLPQTSSLEEIKGHAKGHRPASSVYSRYTNCMPANGQTPPVPPLPLFAVGKNAPVRESDATIFEEQASGLKVPKRGREKNLSVCTVFEEDQPTSRDTKRLTSQSHLPTPRRSRGWWNLITSPFSASSRSNAFFWRSPPPDEEGDRARILDDHGGMIFTNRSSEDVDLRSAPPLEPSSAVFAGKPRQPKRSDTAPGALDPCGQDGVNIYSIPYTGEAANYYNPHKNFPSIIMSPEQLSADRGLDGWSPSQSVYREPRGSVKGVIASVDDQSSVTSENPFADQNGTSRGLADDKSPFSDAHASKAFEGFSGTHPAATADKKFFSTPETEELRGASPDQPARPVPYRNETQESCFSPLTATPIIEDARMGTLINPSVVDVRSTTSRSTSLQHAGLGAVTMASRGVDDADRAPSEKAPFRPVYQHQRNDSYGLGIDTDTESIRSDEKALFPPPKMLAEQPRLGTDRFGQLRIEKEEYVTDGELNYPPWYRRFLWPLLALAFSALLILVVLLVVFIHQPHDDMPVQAQWLNLTGYPPLPTGVMTVVQPTKEDEVGGCVKPQGLWNCAVPNGVQGGDGEAPNLRFEIRFRNKTRDDMNATDLTPSSTSGSSSKRSLDGSAHAGRRIGKRSAWSASLYASLPAPPSKDDMIFLGNTTDGVHEPFEGEETPFYFSLLNASALELPSKTRRLRRRSEKGDGAYPYPDSTASSSSESSDSTSSPDSSDDSNESDDNHSDDSSTPAAPTKIPRPLLLPNGSPAPAQLHRLVQAQPLRLLNRGQDDEHYGFYTYFDRSVFIRTLGGNNSSSSSDGEGNATSSALGSSIIANIPLAESDAVCTFAQTRLHVQIFTRRPVVTSLLSSSSSTEPAAVNSTANDFDSSGSFPYQVTITLDRHGGAADKKGVFCYGIDGEGKVDREVKTWVVEDRGFGGTLVNGVEVSGADEDDEGGEKDGGKGELYTGEGRGIDGGDGGCSCAWQN